MKALFLSILLMKTILGNTQNTSLKVGDKAPTIKVLQWLKGAPISSFDDGKVYVVEFTGSQCVPCRVAAPHLTKLAKKYPTQISIMGICVGENGDMPDSSNNITYVKRVKQFVKAMDSKMDYNIAVDDPLQYMNKNWMKAAGQIGIPCAFLVDKEGRIAWIGHPLEVDEPLDNLVLKNKIIGSNKSLLAIRTDRMAIAESNNDLPTALKIIDSMICENLYNKSYYLQKFSILLRTNEDSAYQFGRMLLHEDSMNDEGVLLYLSRTIISHRNFLKHPDWDLAIDFCMRGDSISIEKDPVMAARHCSLIANIYAEWKNEYLQAINYINRAISIVNKLDCRDQKILNSKNYYEQVCANYEKILLKQ